MRFELTILSQNAEHVRLSTLTDAVNLDLRLAFPRTLCMHKHILHWLHLGLRTWTTVLGSVCLYLIAFNRLTLLVQQIRFVMIACFRYRPFTGLRVLNH